VKGFRPDVIAAAAREREVWLSTYGRKSGKPRQVTVWISTDGRRLFVRSGGGLARHWPQNLLARDQGVLHLAAAEVPVRARHLSSPEEARAVSELVRRKYGWRVKRSRPGRPLTPGEQATFELLPDSEA